jgi:multidrug efflux pump subunit AcrB
VPVTRDSLRRDGVFGYFVRHPTAPHLLLLVMVIAGLYAATHIRSQFFPDIVRQVVTVNVTWSGVGPEEIDKAIIARLEPRLRAVEGLDEIWATARENRASIRLEFESNWDMEAAIDDVKAVVDEVTDLPEDADEPVVRRVRYRDRVTDVVVSGHVPIDLLERYGEELRSRLFRKGVTRTGLVGIQAPEIRIDVRPDTLERHGIGMEAIAEAVRNETGTQPVGEIAKGLARVRTDASRETVSTIGAIPVRSLADGTKLRVSDIATVSEEGMARQVAMFKDGAPALTVRVDRQAEGDSIELEGIVRRTVETMNKSLPSGVEMSLNRTRARAIISRLDLLVRNGGVGLVIVLVMLFLFLSARTAFWVAAGIPIAMLATVGLMYVFGFTFNMVSLFALIICLGIVVDDAIVVGEYTDQLARQGKSPADAATEAARIMSGPVFSASITTVIAFAALTLIGGRFGRLMADLPFTVSVVVIASLLECFFILPAHMRHALTHNAKRAWYDAPSRYVDRGFSWFRERCFRPWIRGVVKLRYPVWGLAFLLLAVSVSAVLDRTVRWRFFLAPERGTITANIAMLPSASRADTESMLLEMERALKSADQKFLQKHGRAPVEFTIRTVGGLSGRGLSGADTMDPDRLGSLDVRLIDPDERSYTAFAFIAEWRDEIQTHAKLERMAMRRDRRGPASDDIAIQLSGANSDVLKQASQELQTELARFKSVSGLEDNLAYDKPELLIKLTPKGEALGFSTAKVAKALRARLDGIEAASFARGSHEVKIKVRLPEATVGRSYLHQAKLPLPGGGFVPLTSLATIEEKQGFSVIRRENGVRQVMVYGELVDDAKVRDEISAVLTSRILPGIAAKYGVNYDLRGLAEDEREFLSDARLGFYLCLVGIFLTLAWVFGSWTRPIAVLLVIPFGLIGAIWGHHLHGVPLTMFSVVGLIGMAGIIINDSIVLVTAIDRRLPTTDMVSAIVDGTAERLRAVFLTTITTVGGLAPLLFEQSRQAAFLKPTVITLVYGLGFGIVVVLMITPTMIAIQEDIRLRIASLRRLLKLATARRRARLN